MGWGDGVDMRLEMGAPLQTSSRTSAISATARAAGDWYIKGLGLQPAHPFPFKTHNLDRRLG